MKTLWSIDNTETAERLASAAPSSHRDHRQVGGSTYVIESVAYANFNGHHDIEVEVTVSFTGGQLRRRYVAAGGDDGYVVTRCDKYLGSCLTRAGVMSMIIKDLTRHAPR